MKLKNKFLALLLAVSMSFSISACGNADAGSQNEGSTETENKDTDVDAYAAAVEKMKDIASLNGKMVMEMDMSFSAGGETQSMQTVTTTDMSCFYDPLRVKVDMNMSAGEDTAMNIQAYAETAEDGTCTLYTYDGMNWTAQTVDASSIEQYDAAGSITGYMQESYNFQDAGTEQIDGKNVRKYTGTMTGDDMREAILATGALNSLSALGLNEEQMDATFKNLGELPVSLWIDETDFYPVKYETDMTDLMNSLMAGLIEAMGEDGEGLSIELSKAKLSMTCSDYNAATEFSIPEEAKAAASAE